MGGGRSDLTARHAIVEIVDANDGDVQITPGSVDKMIAADPGNIAITGKHDHFQFRIRQLKTGGKRDGPPVGGVKRI